MREINDHEIALLSLRDKNNMCVYVVSMRVRDSSVKTQNKL